MLAVPQRNSSLIRRLGFPAFAGALLVALCLILCPSTPAQKPAGPVVAVTGGQVQGGLLPSPGGAVFKGIPFAQPPVGNLRWRETQPVKPWTGVRAATEYGATCAQVESGWNKLAASKASEDCLFLNVWTPEWPAKTKSAVMVWIHGGGNAGGSALGSGGIEPPFDGASLARHGVVVVTIQYRLGVLGYIGHPELTAESSHHASGNYGLMDQIAALKWVHDNIAVFGGDPTKVAVFGQSAGAHDLSVLLTSPLAKGFIQRAIIESGSPMIGDQRPQTEAQLEKLGVILAGVLKAPSTGAIQYLRGLPASEILAAVPEFRKQLNGMTVNVGMDGYVMPQASPEVYREGKEAPVPAIIGTNGAESNGGAKPGGMAGPIDEVRAALKTRVEAEYSKYPDLLDRALKAYGVTGDMSQVSTYPPYGPFDAQFMVDMFMRCEGVALAEWHSTVAPTYRYEFNGGTAAHPPVHSAELALVFGALADQQSDEPVRKLSEAMQEYWTNFAKTGDPNGPGLPKWPRYDTSTRQYIDLSNEGPTAKANLRSVQCGIYVEKLTRDLEARK